MGGENAALCFTSPPYGQQRDYTAEGKEKCSDWDGLMRGVFANLPMTDDGQVLVNLGLIHKDGEWWPYWDGWIEWMRSQGWRRFGWYVWDQMHGLRGDWSGRCAPSHEFIFHFNRNAVKPRKWIESLHAGEKGGALRNKDGGFSAVTTDEIQPFKLPDSVWRIQRQKGGVDGHPAPFSVPLVAFALQSWPGIAYEPFCGSGTTMVAAQNLGRKVYGLEIAPGYCAVILQRMADAFPGIDIRKAD
jgi:DNA modification methylase